jgi:hypothetical protein
MIKPINFAALGYAVLSFGGCLSGVEMAPLPQNHPANPGAPSGVVRPLGQVLLGSGTEERDDLDGTPRTGEERGMGSGMKCGRDHGR